MAALSRATSPAVERMQVEHLRRMPPWRKLALVGEIDLAVQAMALAGLRQRHPDDTVEQRRRLATLLLGSELATQACGPGLEAMGCWPSPSKSRCW